MPIAFPLHCRGRDFERPFWVYIPKTSNFVRAPNMDAPNQPLAAFQCDRGLSQKALLNQQHVPNSGYLGQQWTAVVNPASEQRSPGPAFVPLPTYNRTLGNYLLRMSGVSRDCAGAALGSVRVMLFTTPDNRYVQETTSDGSGNWSMDIFVSGPFYLVEYKAGSPDQAGTSVNTLEPSQVI